MGRILVIDDEPSVQEALSWTLKSANHQVFLASNGREGIEMFKAEAPDLVITDLFMPVQDGIKTILELRQLDPSARILAISGNALSEKVLPITLKLGAVAVLQKPWAVEQLLQSVNALLSQTGSHTITIAEPGPADELAPSGGGGSQS